MTLHWHSSQVSSLDNCVDDTPTETGQSQWRVSVHSYLDLNQITEPEECRGDYTPITFHDTLHSQFSVTSANLMLMTLS